VPVTEDAVHLYETWVGMGGEGTVLKDPASPYRPGERSPAWLKLKPKLTLRAVVTGVTRDGTDAVHGGRLAGPAQDVRFQVGLLDLLEGLEAVGSERRTLLQTIHGYVTVPHVRLRALPVIGAAH